MLYVYPEAVLFPEQWTYQQFSIHSQVRSSKATARGIPTMGGAADSLRVLHVFELRGIPVVLSYEVLDPLRQNNNMTLAASGNRPAICRVLV